MLQDNQLDEDVKKALVVLFYAGNIRKKINIDKDIINPKDYLDDNMAKDNNLAIDQENLNIK